MSKPTTAPRMSKQQRWKNREMRGRGYECYMDGKLLVAEKRDSKIVHNRNGHVVDEELAPELRAT